MQSLRQTISGLFIAAIAYALALPVYAQGLITNKLSGESGAGNTAGYDTSQGLLGVSSIVGTIIQMLLSLLGVIFLSLIVYGGYTWMQARGEEEDVKKAQGTIRTGIIGLIIIFAAYIITTFIIENVSTETLL